jgi:alkanesulfonate monooxygenase SsuD/methylene tetrahydromethanopterin reductase-like flavin-dependent oxidoreductase (luciferase family)
MCPDVVQFLSYMAGKTDKTLLGSMVVVLPWHDPMRVAEQISMLDNMSGGRMILGMGRGVGRIEYEGFRLNMNESREMFDEYATMVVEALENGYMERDGQFVKQPKRDIRPRPFKSFKGRTYTAAVSPESMPIVARLGMGLMIVPQKPWKMVENDIAAYTKVFEETHKTAPPPPLVAGWTFVDESADRAAEVGREYIRDYYRSVIKHYEFASDHLTKTKGYEFYGQGFQRKVEEIGIEGVVDFLASMAVCGTPEQCYEQIMHQHKLIGMNAFMAITSYSGMPWDEAERNMQLFAKTVMPELKKFDTPPLQLAKSA